MPFPFDPSMNRPAPKCGVSLGEPNKPCVRLGIENFLSSPSRWVGENERVGLLLNPSSVDSRLQSSKNLVFDKLGDRLKVLFGPQHGINSDVQDNMIETPDGVDPEYGIPVWSLYGKTRIPLPGMLKDIEVLLIDIQDVGTRVYTFIWTIRNIMEACAKAGVRVIVLDRPNPVGCQSVEGNLLDLRYRSFVGLEAIPMRHGLTVGELARWFVQGCNIPCALDVVPMTGYTRDMHWPHTGLAWAMPSPNMPTYDTALVYPGTVLIEGTNASEGRGTTRPFELIGGPWGEYGELARAMNDLLLPGVYFRPLVFEPTFHKWQGQKCNGFQMHVTDAGAFNAYLTGVAMLSMFWKLYRSQGFAWRLPPYEYEEVELPIHLLLGSDWVRENIEAGSSVKHFADYFAKGEELWREETKTCLLY